LQSNRGFLMEIYERCAQKKGSLCKELFMKKFLGLLIHVSMRANIRRLRSKNIIETMLIN